VGLVGSYLGVEDEFLFMLQIIREDQQELIQKEQQGLQL